MALTAREYSCPTTGDTLSSARWLNVSQAVTLRGNRWRGRLPQRETIRLLRRQKKLTRVNESHGGYSAESWPPCARWSSGFMRTRPTRALLTSTSLNAADTYYNLLVQGFRAGQLSLKKEVPPGLAQLADPYDPTANRPYRALTARPELLQGQVLPLFWGYARRGDCSGRSWR